MSAEDVCTSPHNRKSRETRSGASDSHSQDIGHAAVHKCSRVPAVSATIAFPADNSHIWLFINDTSPLRVPPVANSIVDKLCRHLGSTYTGPDFKSSFSMLRAMPLGDYLRGLSVSYYECIYTAHGQFPSSPTDMTFMDEFVLRELFKQTDQTSL